MFEKSNLLLARATRSRGYTDETHLRGFKSLDFSLSKQGRLEVAATQTKPTFVGSKAFKEEVNYGEGLSLSMAIAQFKRTIC
ncbi:hypothetical protein NIES806_32570 [Dolichospermum compactum NIES-806]|uniref:Uncharacterized protein n=1 Tax=Dolichospermum compactum NIES-806 TaxID=1973481 RepID=A0A1Z4V6S4_9CYAN|nr:hypothetical protein NIES806_32570 [Dolichospermum compactum NIES-806]